MSRRCALVVCLVLSWVSAGIAAERPTKAKSSRPATIDFRLDQRNRLQGTVLNRAGKAVPGATVRVVQSRERKPQTARTDAKGQFVVSKLATGLATVQIGPTTHRVRLWQKAVAPPAARHQALFVVGDAVRGQCAGAGCPGCASCSGHFGGVFQRVLQNPWFVSTGTAAAIAVPLAAGDDDAS